MLFGGEISVYFHNYIKHTNTVYESKKNVRDFYITNDIVLRYRIKCANS